MICGDLDTNICNLLNENSIYFGAAALHSALFFLALLFLWEKDLQTTLKKLAFPGDIQRNLILSGAGFILVIFVLLFLGVVATLTGFNDQEAVYEKVADLPVYILLFAIFLAPITEELFFRALLVPRIGIIFSAILFGLMHVSYGSVIEIVGAGLIGVVLAIMFRISKSITPCIIIHVTYNLFSIIVMRFLI
ncbi:CPBP family intramembrane metalloprotease [Candidatus Micrarchaeota archaeon]|nr:CPBP family intramembrane metalloprotease [Candidatus Micrarchaeota archaeon]